MSFPPVHYRVVGQDDYMLDITLNSSGDYRVDCGDHTSHKPRQGRLDDARRAGLQRLLADLGAPREHPAPVGATGFMAELTVGDPSDRRHYRFWEGALDEEPDLRALVRALEVI